MEPINILALCGSLRAESLNRRLLLSACELAPEELEFRIGEIDTLPLYNADVEAQAIPESVKNLHQQLCGCSAVLIVSPEYNYSIPAPLKNAIDWLSRMPNQGFSHKPVALMGISPSRMGTARGQLHLRQVMVSLNAWVLNQPEVMLCESDVVFNDDGQLQTEHSAELVRRQLLQLARMVH